MIDTEHTEKPVANVLLLQNGEKYTSKDFSMQREWGKSPNGNPLQGQWVLRNSNGDWIDFNHFRCDLAERYGLKLDDIPIKFLFDLKVGRKTYGITTKDKFMANGACVQLITRTVRVDSWHTSSPVLSKQAASKINKLKGFTKKLYNHSHGFGPSVSVFSFVPTDDDKN